MYNHERKSVFIYEVIERNVRFRPMTQDPRIRKKKEFPTLRTNYHIAKMDPQVVYTGIRCFLRHFLGSSRNADRGSTWLLILAQ